MRLRSVRHKLVAGVLLTTVAALLLTTVALMIFDLRSYRESLSTNLTTQARLMARACADALRSGDRRTARANLALLEAQPQVRAAALYDARGALFATYVRGNGKLEFPRLPQGKGLSESGNAMAIFSRVEANDEFAGDIYLIADYSLSRRVARYAGVAATVTAGALALSLLLSLWLQRLVTQPIEDMSRLARDIVERHDFSTRVKKVSGDEIGTLAQALNTMLAETERHISAKFESEARYRSLVEAIAQIIWTADARGMVARSAPSWQAYTGQSDAEVLGDGWATALHPQDAGQALRAWRAAVDQESVYKYEYRVRRRDGEYRWFAVRGVPVRREDGSIREWVRVCFDIHDQRGVEEEARTLRAELEARVRERTAQLEAANRELEAFSYSVSHDLRAPLRAVDGFSQALVEDYAERADKGMRRYLERIRGATRHMGQLIDDLLDLSRISRIELEPVAVDLSALARQVVKALQLEAPAREVEVTIWDDVTGQGDARLLRVVLENLLANAWKFTSKIARPMVEFGALREPQRTVYFVRDNGAGFDMAHAGNLFAAFHRLHAAAEFPGTGIGLAIVQRVIHRHDGRIWAHAQPGKGAAFFFTLGGDAGQPAQEAQA